MENRSRVKSLCFCALSIALLAVCSYISIPLGPVPFTLQTMALGIIVLLLSPTEILVTIGVYLLIGAIGLPVFDSMKGGFGVILGPTGGFLIGFFVGGAIAAIIKKVAGEKFQGKIALDAVLLFVTLLSLYTIGWIQLSVVTNIDLMAALFVGVLPFLIPEVGKLVVVILSAKAVRMALGVRPIAKKENS